MKLVNGCFGGGRKKKPSNRIAKEQIRNGLEYLRHATEDKHLFFISDILTCMIDLKGCKFDVDFFERAVEMVVSEFMGGNIDRLSIIDRALNAAEHGLEPSPLKAEHQVYVNQIMSAIGCPEEDD